MLSIRWLTWATTTGACTVGTSIRLIEPVPVEDDLCTGLAMIEDLGFCARFVLFHQQTCYETGRDVCVVKRKIVLPIVAIQPGLEMAAGFLGRRAIAGAGKLLRVVL